MEEANGITLVVLICATLAVVAILCRPNPRARRQALAAEAQRLGLEFSPYSDPYLARCFGFLNQLAKGDNRYALNVLFGNFRGYAVQAFDYHYETYHRDSDGSRETRDHYFSCLVLTLEKAFPELTIAREGFLSKVAQALGYEDIDFESNEFSQAFCVRCKDKKFAYDFCNARMIDWLLFNRDLVIELEGTTLAITFPECILPSYIERNLERLVQLRLFMPKYLFS